jgi:hypothetical protein
MKMEQTECFKTLAYKIQKPGNYPEENIQHTEHSESSKSRFFFVSYIQQGSLKQPSEHHIPLAHGVYQAFNDTVSNRLHSVGQNLLANFTEILNNCKSQNDIKPHTQ